MSAHRLEIRDLTVTYRRVPAIHHVDLDLQCGRRIALLGPNGAGKTTLLKAMVGLVSIESGTISLGGHERSRHRPLTYLPQRGVVDWNFPTTVRGLVEMGRYAHLGWWRPFRENDRQIVDDALRALQLTGLAERQIGALSGGQQQRAFLARALAQQAHVFLLDEPFTGLDQPAQEVLGRTMRQLSDAGHLVIASHHDLKSVSALFEEVIFLNGELIAHGPAATTFTDANIAKTFQAHVLTGREAASA